MGGTQPSPLRGAESGAPGILEVLDLWGAAGREVDRDQVEAVEVIGATIPRDPDLCCSTYIESLSPPQRLEWVAIIESPPRLYFHEDHDLTLPRDQIDLFVPCSEVLGEDPPSGRSQELGSDLLAPAT